MGQVFAYACVSTDAQDIDPQTDELQRDGFDVLVVEKASDASRTRPELARPVWTMKAGDILKVGCITDRTMAATSLRPRGTPGWR